MTDRELVLRAQNGDLDSFGMLVTAHRGAVHGLAYHWTGSFDDAEDIAQEAFVRAYLNLRQLREPDRFAAWLWRLARNECQQWRRRQRPAAPLADVEDTLTSPQPSPTDDLEQTETRRLVQRSLRRLSDKNRLAISLHYLGGLSYEEIAQFLDLSTNAVAARLHRARRELEAHLMDAIGNSLRGEQLDDEFTHTVLEQARKRARESQSQWRREAFQISVEQGLEAARQLRDRQAEGEMLSMLGEAGASWLGDSQTAVSSYEAALGIAREAGDPQEEGRLLECLWKALLRHGDWERARQRASDAVEVWRATGDLSGQALAQAALDLGSALPGQWTPGEAGGYAAAALPVASDEAGLTWEDLVADRHYSWGCPSRCAALMHLYRPRRFLGPALEVGATWEDRLQHGRDAMSWSTDASEPEPVARSEVRRRDASVLTPAGPFDECLEVQTTIAPLEGGRAAEYSTRSYCGARTAWYAPGVGLVKARHDDQNGQTWEVQLAEWEGAGGDGYFPLEPGCVWRYRWLESMTPTIIFEDLCRAVGTVDGTTWIASATWGREQTAVEAGAYLAEQAELARRAGDLAGQATALEALVHLNLNEAENAARREQLVAAYDGQLEAARVSGDRRGEETALRGIARHCGDRERVRSCIDMVKALCEEHGDDWGALLASQALRGSAEGVEPEENAPMLRERVELARRLGDRGRESAQLLELAHKLLELAQYPEAARLFEQYSQLVGDGGDIVQVAHGIGRAELAWALSEVEDPAAYAWWRGEARPQAGSSRSRWQVGEGVSGWTTPMTDLFEMAPLSGLALLTGKVGESTTDWFNTEVSSGAGFHCESMRATATLASLDDEVAAAAGNFESCARVDVSVSTSAEERRAGEETIAAQLDYYAGTKQVWYAPAVGLVRLRYQHRNDLVTEVELVDYEVGDGAAGWLPMAIGNRWRYAWVEAAGAARFEDVWRVAAHREGKWAIGFATRAEPIKDTRRPQPA